jgi:hypothetical protein
MKILFQFFIFALAAFVASGQSAATTVSNFGETADGTILFMPNGVSGSFTTGNNSWTLDSITASLLTGGSDTPIQGSIYSDSGGLPGSELNSLGTILAPALVQSNFTFTSISSFLLAPNTTYWLMLSASPGADWFETSLTAENSGYGWTIGDAHYFTGAYSTTSSSPIFSVSAEPVPEPTAIALFFAGLGCFAFRRFLFAQQ